jgi:hypothetical protein
VQSNGIALALHRHAQHRALIYPIAVPAICFVLSLFLMPETRERSIWEEPVAQKA